MLVVAGVLLQPVYWQIVVVLQWLGVLTALLAVLVVLRARGWIAIGASLGVLALAYPLMVATRGAWLPPGSLAWAVEYIASGGPYRLLPLMSAGLLGVGLTHWLGRDTVSPRSSLLVAVLAGGGAAIVVVIGKATALGADPYSGTYPEMLASLCLVTMTLSLSRWLTDTLPDSSLGWLDPIVATGRMAMTAYVLQSVVLRILADAFLGGSRDDHWWVLATTLVVLVGVSWAWRRFVGQGPFEWLLRVHLPLFRRVPVS